MYQRDTAYKILLSAAAGNYGVIAVMLCPALPGAVVAVLSGLVLPGLLKLKRHIPQKRVCLTFCI